MQRYSVERLVFFLPDTLRWRFLSLCSHINCWCRAAVGAKRTHLFIFFSLPRLKLIIFEMQIPSHHLNSEDCFLYRKDGPHAHDNKRLQWMRAGFCVSPLRIQLHEKSFCCYSHLTVCPSVHAWWCRLPCTTLQACLCWVCLRFCADGETLCEQRGVHPDGCWILTAAANIWQCRFDNDET